MAIRIFVDTPEEKETLLRESQNAWGYVDNPEDNTLARLHLNPDMIEVIITEEEITNKLREYYFTIPNTSKAVKKLLKTVEPKTNIELLGNRYETLMNAGLADTVYLVTHVGDAVFWLKAFMASGERQQVDGHWYYTQVPETVVLELGVNSNGRPWPEGQYDRFIFLAHKEGGYLMTCPSGMKRQGMWAEWYAAFLPLMTRFEEAVAHLPSEPT